MKKYLNYILITIFIFLFNVLSVFAEENVELTKVELKEKSDYVEINEEVSLDGNKIISNVNFFDEGDYVLYQFTIKNNDNKDYRIDEIFDNNESEYLEFEYTYDGDLGAKSEKDILLKVTYKSALPYDSILTPESVFNATSEITVKVKLEEVVLNPATFDNAHLYLLIEIIAVITLLIIFIKLKKKNAIILLILAIIFVPKNVNAQIEFELNFTFKNTMTLKANFLSSEWKSKISGTYSKIEFIKTSDFKEEAVDVSEEENETIKAWIDNDTLYFGSRYIIFFPVNSKNLFDSLQLQSIIFNNRVDTTFVTDMTKMLSNNKFEEIDVSSFRTGNVTGMSQIFNNNSNLKKLDLSSFDMSNVITLYGFFDNCGKLEELIIDGWNLSNVSNISTFLRGENKLKSISAKNFVFPRGSSSLFRTYLSSTVLESIDLTGADASHAVSFYGLFRDLYALKEIKGLEDLDTSNLTSISYMFSNTGYTAKGANYSFDLSGWNLSKVTSAFNVFEYFGYEADSIDLNVSNWDISNVESISYVFRRLGYNAKEVNINISGWNNNLEKNFSSSFEEIGYNSNKVSININDVSLTNVTSGYHMFYNIGNSAKEVNININNLNLSKVTSAEKVFDCVGYDSENVNINVNGLNLASTNSINNLFQYVGKNAKTVNINLNNWTLTNLSKLIQPFYYTCEASEKCDISISNFDTPNLSQLLSIFYQAGNKANYLKIKLNNINTSSLTQNTDMFNRAGENADTFIIEGLDTIDLSHVNNIRFLLSNTSKENARVDFGTVDIYAYDIGSLLSNSKSAKIVINLHNNPTSYNYAFENAAISEGSEIIVNYTADVTNIDNIIATKSPNSNVIKGHLIEE